MRDPKRIDIVLDELGKLWKLQPNLRLGQLVSYICARSTAPPSFPRDVERIFYVEDEDVLDMIIKARHENELPS